MHFPPENYQSIKIIPNAGPSIFTYSSEGIVYPIGDIESYGHVFFNYKGINYYSRVDYLEDVGNEGKKKKKKTIKGINLISRKKKKEEEESSGGEDEEMKSDNEDDVENKREKALSTFLKPAFIDQTIPKASLSKVTKDSNFSSSTNLSQYLIFNGAQARVRYIVILEEAADELLDANNRSDNEDSQSDY